MYALKKCELGFSEGVLQSDLKKNIINGFRFKPPFMEETRIQRRATVGIMGWNDDFHDHTPNSFSNAFS